MKKLNNKGLTTIELLISFVLLAILVASLYGTVETYKNRQSIEEFKDEIYTYKNLLTKEVQSDLIKKGLMDVKIESTPLMLVILVILFQKNIRQYFILRMVVILF